MNGPSELYPYPCIRYFHFVSLRMCINPIYSSILEAGKKGGTIFLDIGCCSTTFLFVSLHDNHMGSIVGTDVRKLVYDGYPASSVLGSDLREAYIEAGYKLFRDSKTCGIHFFSSELFDIPVNLASTSAEIPLSQIKVLWQLANRVTHLYVGALFHLFDEVTQYAIALRMAIVLKRDSGGVIFGRHQGLANEGLIEDHLARVRYGHSPESWKLLWHRVFTELEGPEFADKGVAVDAEFKEKVQIGSMEALMMYWSVRIL